VTQCIDDTTAEIRWAGWSAAVAGSGIRSTLSIPLVHRGRSLGTLKVYAGAPAVFGDAEERLLGLLAEAAATLLGTTQAMEAPALQDAATQEKQKARETVKSATEILMNRDHLGPVAARAALLELARTQGWRLIDVAAQILEATVGQEQARQLGTTMIAADIDRADLWLYQCSIGGDVDELEVDAYLNRCLDLPRFQRGLLALAANEILEETTPPRAPYAAEILTDPDSTAVNGYGPENPPHETR
jgi:hypothetical protein